MQVVGHIYAKTNILPKTNSKYLAGVLYHIDAIVIIEEANEDVYTAGNLILLLWKMIEELHKSMHLHVIAQWQTTNLRNSTCPIEQWVF